MDSNSAYVTQLSDDPTAYLTAYAKQSDYVYRLNSDGTLGSSSTDVLSWYGDDRLYFLQNGTKGATPLPCRMTGSYPAHQLSCSAEKDGAFGDYGTLYYGTKAYLKALGAPRITLTVRVPRRVSAARAEAADIRAGARWKIKLARE